MTLMIDRSPDNISTQNGRRFESSVCNAQVSPETRRPSQRHHGYLFWGVEWTGAGRSKCPFDQVSVQS